MRLVLASSSPRRAEVLAAAGFAFELSPARVDESRRAAEPVEVYVCRLAEAKARAAAEKVSAPAIVIGADTVVLLDGEALGKPESASDAAQMLRRLSGRTHEVLTGLAAVKIPEDVARVEIEKTKV